MLPNKYRLNFFKNMHDNVVDISEDYTWAELVELFSTHSISSDKDVMMFNTCEFKTEDYLPAEFNVKDFEGNITGRQAITRGGKTCVGRLSGNVISYNCLVFDFDGGDNNLENIIERFSNYTHLGYTSFNHVVKGVDKCRVVLPLLNPIPVDEFKLRRKSILSFSNVDDESTTAIARAFYMPSHTEENTQHAFTWNVEGELCDWKMFDAEIRTATPLPVRTVAGVTGGTGAVIWESFDIVQFFKDQGLYINASGSGKHNVKCPNVDHEDGGTVIFEATAGDFAKFYCSHKSCVGFKFWDHYKTLLGAGWMKDWCLREPTITKQDVINRFKSK